METDCPLLNRSIEGKGATVVRRREVMLFDVVTRIESVFGFKCLRFWDRFRDHRRCHHAAFTSAKYILCEPATSLDRHSCPVSAPPAAIDLEITTQHVNIDATFAILDDFLAIGNWPWASFP